MAIWKDGKGWRYEFEIDKVRYSGTATTKAAARALREDHKRAVKAQAKTPTDTDFREVANEYLDFCKRKFSEKNYKEKVFIFKSFLAHCQQSRCLEQIAARDILDYLSTRPTNENWNKHRKSICAFFQWAFKHGMVRINPCLYVDAMPENPKRKAIPSQEEMLKILLASGEYRPFFLCLYGLAARLGEINRLKWEDVNFEKRIVTLWTKKGNGTYRAQPKALNDELYEELRRLYNKRCGEWIFPNPDTGLPYRNRRAQIRRACLNAGVAYYSWHCIRHHVASLLSDTFKQSLPTIQKMLGHQRATTTERYIQSLGGDLRDAADLLQINTPQKDRNKNSREE